eukprot:Skav233863  [mRNA]  locus=scaffold1483:26069:27127:+ [translate_table: standard]
MEVMCLNGASVAVKPWESLQEAKVKVAKALGTFPEAVQISCGGQILSGETLETLENCLEKLKETVEDVEDTVEDVEDGNGHPPLFAVVDQMRMELARHLHYFEPELVATQKQLAKMEKKKAELGQKQKELFLGCGYHDCYDEVLRVESCLKEGNLSLQKEKALVSRLAKLKRLSKMESELDEDRETLYSLQLELREKISDARNDLQKALKESQDDIEAFNALLAEFDGARAALEPQRFRLFDAQSYDSWLDYDPYLEEEQLMLAEIASCKIAEELKDSIPRLLRREAWSSKKSKGKYSRKAPPGEKCDDGRKGRPALSRCSRQRQRGCRRVLRRDVSNQLQEYSLEVSGLKH